MTDPFPPTRTPSAASSRIVPPRPRPQPTPRQPSLENSLPTRQRSASGASTSSARQQVRRQSSREGVTSISQGQPSQQPQRPGSETSLRHPEQPSDRPPLAPFYTIVGNTASDITHHPRVHYIFSDDDDNESLSRALDHASRRVQQIRHNHTQVGANYQLSFSNAPQSTSDDEDSLASANKDRAILLDLEPTADGNNWNVAAARSLSPDWAVVSARICHMNDGDSGNGNADDGFPPTLMLKIEGAESWCHSFSSHGSPAGAAIAAAGDIGNLDGSRGSTGRTSSNPVAYEYDTLVEDFNKRLAIMRQVIEAGPAISSEQGTLRSALGVVEEESIDEKEK